MVALTFREVSSLVSMTWRDLELGFELGLVDMDGVRGFAEADIARVAEPGAALIELATASDSETAYALVQRLASEQPRDEAATKAKWLYVLLAVGYARRGSLADPLELVEEVYAAFDYPAEIESFVRYMPAKPGAELGESALLRSWERWLENRAKHYAAP